MTSTTARALAGTLVLGILAAGALFVSPSATLATVESVAADPYLFGLAVAGLYLLRPLLAWPTTPLAVVVGYGYGVALGVPVALAGVVLTAIPPFLAVRWLADGDGLPGSILGRAGDAATGYYDHAGPIRGVTASRLAPIHADVSTAAAAAGGVRLRHLAVGTAVGELPWTAAGVVVGASAATVATAGLGELGASLTVACALAAALLLSGPAYRLVRERPLGGQSA